MANSEQINDYLGPGGLSSVAVVQTDASGNTVLLGPDGPYAALPLDANGNVIANINHRTGYLNSLLLLTGGDGEIAKATDANALVVYDGQPLGGKAFYRSTKIAEVHVHGTIAALTGGTASVVDLTSSTVNYGGMEVDLANDKFRPPATTKYVKMTLQIYVSDADVTANTKLSAYVDYWVPGFGWSNLLGTELFEKLPVGYLQATGDVVTIVAMTSTDKSSILNRDPSTDEGFIQIRLLHNDATDVYSNVEVSAAFEFFGAN